MQLDPDRARNLVKHLSYIHRHAAEIQGDSAKQQTLKGFSIDSYLYETEKTIK